MMTSQDDRGRVKWLLGGIVMLFLLMCSTTQILMVGEEQQQWPQQPRSYCPIQPEMNVDLCDSPSHVRDRASQHGQSSVELSLDEGARCYVESHSGHIMIQLTCLDGHWTQTASHVKRSKRGISIIIGAIIGAVLPQLLNPQGGLFQQNKAPTITCPSIDATQTAEGGKTTIAVTWATAKAFDPEDGYIGVSQTEGQRRGTEHGKGHHTVSYLAQDSSGMSASCSTSFTVEVLECPLDYINLLNGQVTCSNEKNKNIYGSECTYTCNAGYMLQGDRSVVCQRDKTWTAVSKPVCQPISCGDPGAITNGTINCIGNSNTKHDYQSKCVVSCRSGYAVAGNDIIVCQADGQWSQPGKCVDAEAPSIECEDIEVYAGPQLEPVKVQWTTPVTRDNSGLPVNVTSDLPSGTFFQREQTKVTFTAKDAVNNVNSCSMMVIVNVKRCPHLPAPDHANVTCSHGNAYGSECTFTCHQAYELEGDMSCTCQEDETWDGQQPECTPRSCVAPPIVSHGMYQCRNGQQYQESCSLTCDSGYKPVAPLTITCDINIQWSQSGYCLDVEAPEFSNGCPADMSVTAASLGEPTYVTYDLPDVTDNSGDVPTVVGEPVSGSAFDQGTTTVRITGFDSRGNNTSCEFVVSVRNVSCDRPSVDTTGKDLIAYECADSYVYGASCLLTCKDGNPLTGAATIKCDGDPNTNELTWTWSGTVQPYCDPEACPKLDTPKNGALACDKLGSTGEQCILMCDQNYMYPSTAPDLYTCFSSRGDWAPDKFIPGCITRRRPGKPYTRPEFYYFTHGCSSNSTEIRDKFHKAIESSSLSSLCKGNTVCSLSTVEVSCGPTSTRRRKRSVYAFEYQISPTITFSSYEDQGSPADTKEFYNNLVVDINHHLMTESENGVFSVPEIGKYDTYHNGQPEYDCPTGTKIVYTTMSCAGCGKGHTYDNSSSSCVSCPQGTYQDQEISFSCIKCPSGTTTRDIRTTSVDQCLDLCPFGQFSSTGIPPCELCPVGSYQSQKGMTSCSVCPFGKSTLSSGALSESDCLFFNVRLSESSTGPIIQLFESNPRTFTFSTWITPVSSSLTMTLTFDLDISTSAGNETAVIGLDQLGVLVVAEQAQSGPGSSVRKWQHIAVVYSNGQSTLFVNGHNQSTLNNVYLTNLDQTTFTYTPSHNLPSVLVSGFQMTGSSLTESEIINMWRSCDQQVKTNLLAVSKVDTSLVTPSSCDDENNCAGDPCGQHGICVDGTGDFTCVCDKLWSGDTCEHAPDYCLGHECANSATCSNQPEWGNYSCHCVSGFKGALCDQTVVDGSWGTWQEWSVCSVTCGSGQRSRVRQCDNPSPDPQGQDCQGDSEEQEACMEAPCPVNAVWGPWSTWTCGVTCGEGTAIRTRSCDQPAANGGLDCQGPSRNADNCQLSACPVDGDFGEWSGWSQCSATCGGGVSTRHRDCNNPSASLGGVTCDSNLATEVLQCNTHVCPVCDQPELLPGHQAWNCSFDNSTDMQTCQIECKSGLVITPPHHNRFLCGRQTNYAWTHQTQDNPVGLLPQCSDQQVPESFIPQLTITYDIDCNKPPALSDVVKQGTFQMDEVPCAVAGTCNYNVTAENLCDKRKRSAGLVTMSVTLDSSSYSATEPQYLSTLSAAKQEEERAKLESIVEIVGQVLNSSQTGFGLTINGVQYTGQIQSVAAFVSCVDGSGFYDGYCMICPAGSYADGNGLCILCEQGYYQVVSGQNACEQCPAGTTTSGVGSYSPEHCKIDPLRYEDVFPSYLAVDDVTTAVSGIQVTVTTSTTDGREKGDDTNVAVGPIVGGVAAGVFLVLVAGFVFCFNKHKWTQWQPHKATAVEDNREVSVRLISHSRV